MRDNEIGVGRAGDAAGIEEISSVALPGIDQRSLANDGGVEHRSASDARGNVRRLSDDRGRSTEGSFVVVKGDGVVVGIAKNHVGPSVAIDIADSNAPRIPAGGIANRAREGDRAG